MEPVQRFTNDLQVEEEAHMLDPSNMEQLATFVASVAISETVGEDALAIVRARIDAFKKNNDSGHIARLEQTIYKNFRQYRRAGLLQDEGQRLAAEKIVERFFPYEAPN